MFPITGLDLKLDLENLQITRRAIASEFIYERDIMLISGDSGIGKSSIALQMCYELTTMKKLFNSIDINFNVPVLYLQLEGDYEETIERLRLIEQATGVKTNHEMLTIWNVKNFDCSDKEQRKYFFDKINELNFKPGLFVGDPMYKMTMKDISKYDGALAVVEFSDYVHQQWGCSNLFIHHNTKSTYEIIDGKKVQKGDSYYGHSFLKNHFRTCYTLKSGDGKYSPIMKRQKGRGSDTISKMELAFDAEFGHTTTKENFKSCEAKFVSAMEKLKASQNKTTNFNAFAEISDISEAQLRRIKKTELFSSHFKVEKEEGKNKELWIIVR